MRTTATASRALTLADHVLEAAAAALPLPLTLTLGKPSPQRRAGAPRHSHGRQLQQLSVGRVCREGLSESSVGRSCRAGGRHGCSGSGSSRSGGCV